MMNSTYASFQKEIQDVRDYIAVNSRLIEEEGLNEELKKYIASRKKKEFDYKSLIISIYGILENYIETIVKLFLEELEKNIPDYNELDSKIRDNHFSFSLNLAAIISESKYLKYSSLSKEDVVVNLNKCLANEKGYKLNTEAFTIKSGNLKHVKVCELFNGVGIDLNNLLSQKEAFNVNSENKFNKIDLVVQLRNEIAHGSVSDILSFSEIEPILNFIESYITEVFNIVDDVLINIVLSYKSKYECNPVPVVKCFAGNIIGIKNNGDCDLKSDDILIIKKNNGCFMLGKIISCKVEGDYKTLKIDKNIRKGYNYFCEKT